MNDRKVIAMVIITIFLVATIPTFILYSFMSRADDHVYVDGTIQSLKSSPVDGKIVFSVYNYDTLDTDIWTLDIGDRKLLQIKKSRNQTEPNFSPDGKKIVFVEYQPQRYSHIKIIDADGSNADTLRTTERGYFNYPAFTYDGSKIIFTYSNQTERKLCYMNSDGANEKLIMYFNETGLRSLTASPINNTILMHLGPSFVITDLDGSFFYNLTDTGFGMEHPAISPDGRNIVYSSEEDRDIIFSQGSGGEEIRKVYSDIWMMDIDGSNHVRILNSDHDKFYPVFKNDGSRILYIIMGSGKDDHGIYMMDKEGTDNHMIVSTDISLYGMCCSTNYILPISFCGFIFISRFKRRKRVAET